MEGLSFVAPAVRWKDSYADALEEGLELALARPEQVLRIRNDFDAWLRDKYDLNKVFTAADGKTYKPVPFSEFWLVRDDYFIGRASLRHEISTEELRIFGGHIGYAVRKPERKKGYGRMLLQMTLPKAKELGLDRVLLTCRDNNEGSIRIIEGAGGVLEDKIQIPDQLMLQRRYWIML